MDFLKMTIFLKRSSHYYTAPITCTITCNITCNVGRRRQRGQTGPELSKSSKMSSSEHANLAEYIEPAPFGGATSLGWRT